MSQTSLHSDLPRTEFRSDERVVFVSDIHLYFEGGPYLDVFLRFLREVGQGAAAVFIHGDLFDFFVGPRQGRLPFYRPLFEALRRLVQSGTPVTVLHGNRDFLMGREFSEVGVHVVADELRLRLGEKQVHLSHGDQFCIHDRSYLFWARGVLRARPIAWTVRHLPVSFAVWLARRYRAVSKRKMERHQGGGRLPTILDGVTRFVGQESFDALICGHIHHLARTSIEVGSKRALLFTTGAWDEGPNYISFDGGRLELATYAKG